uniref:Adenosine 5'-monophosphoramidase HINT3 n=1 Tax=Lepeophtheirus salmonis TaxID=72036 RepID=A0A0K2UNW5_LEPSM
MALNRTSCVFCQIASKTLESRIIFEDGNFVAFPDRSPAAKHHYLIIPKDHHPKVNQLEKSHIEMLRSMGRIAEQVLQENGESITDAKIGFHWPIVTVNHLHIHAISPASEMSGMFKKFEFSSLFFGSLEDAILMLEKKSSS